MAQAKTGDLRERIERVLAEVRRRRDGLREAEDCVAVAWRMYFSGRVTGVDAMVKDAERALHLERAQEEVGRG